MKNIYRIIKLVIPNVISQFIIFLVISLPVYILPLVLIMLEKKIIDNISISGTNFRLSELIFVLFLMFFVYIAMTWLEKLSKRYLEFNLFHSVLYFLGKTIRDKLRELTLDYFEDAKTYKKISLAQNSIDYIAFTLSTTLFILLFLVNVVSISIYLASLKIYFMFLVLLISLSVFLDIYQESFSKADLAKNIVNERRKSDYFIGLLTKSNAKEIKVNGAGNFIYTKHFRAIKELLTISNDNNIKIFKKSFVISILIVILQGTAYFILFRLLIVEVITIAEFLATITAFSVVSQTLNQLFMFLGNLFQYSILADPYFDLINLEKNIYDNNLMLEKSKIVFQLDNVSFRYPGSESLVLENISFKIGMGESAAIVGINGAGKSTLIKLMVGYYKPTSGDIYINGINTKSISDYYIASITSTVFQNYGMYKFSVLDNIQLSDSKVNLDLKKVDKALNWVDLKGKLSASTMLGKEFGGIELSGGTWQKIALARACYRNREIYIFDEPTASVDPLFEVDMFDKLKELSKDATSILVSHRLGALKDVDKIIVLNNKKVIEEGDFDTLIKNRVYFYNLWETQKSWYK